MQNNPLMPEGQKVEQFVRLLTANQNGIYAYILSLVLKNSDAEDIMQDTTVLMWRKFNEFAEGTDFLRWGIAIARNTIYSFWRKQKKSPHSFSETTIEALESDSNKVIGQLDSQVDYLKKCLGQLPVRDREIVQMHYEQNLAVKKISERVGKSVQAVYKSLARVHGILMRCVQRAMDTEGLL